VKILVSERICEKEKALESYIYKQGILISGRYLLA